MLFAWLPPAPPDCLEVTLLLIDARFSPFDAACMDEALELAARARCRTHPNPMVGCVIAGEGRVIGRGYHQKAGQAHAETLALLEAGAAARGAVAYVTLEPCAHHGRTPPCAEALVAAGISRVVVAMQDPDPRVSGRGVRILQDAGVQVQVGLRETAARELNRAWLHYKKCARPYTLLKVAMTLDGKIACSGGDSRWVTGPDARAHVHRLRDQTDAILVGVGTVLADNPQLTTRLPEGKVRHPTRVVVDSTLRTPLDARIITDAAVRDSEAPTIIATTEMASPERIQALTDRGATVWVFAPDGDGLVPLGELLDRLAAAELVSLLVEGGGQVHWSFLSQGLVQRLLVYVAPKLVGGLKAPGPVGGPGISRMAEAWRLRDVSVREIGGDFLFEGTLAL